MFQSKFRGATALRSLVCGWLALLVGTGAQAAITFKQGAYSAPAGPLSIVTATYASAQTAGGLNVVAVAWDNATSSVSSVTDSKGNAYSLAIGPTKRAGTASQSIYYARNIAAASAGGNIVTVTFSTAVPFPDIRILEYAGIDTVSPLHTTVGANGSSATTSSGAMSVTVSNALLVAANYVAHTTTGAGTSFTNRMISNDGSIAEDRIVTAAGSYTGTAPQSPSGWWIMQMVAFKPAASDTTPPTAPATITATVISSTQINLSWSPSTDNVGVTGYQIDRCQGVGCGTFAQIGTSATASFNNTGLSASTSYSYRVRATDAAGNIGANSSIVSSTTQAAPDTIAPSAPTGLSASAASGTQINLSWAASTDNVGVTGYLVERCQGANCATFTQIGTPTAASFNDTGLTVGASYSYRVRATDAATNLSAYSAVASTTTLAPPSAPSALNATSSGTTVSLVWTDTSSNETGFKVERKTGAGGTYAQIGTTAVNVATYSDAGLTVGTAYFYRVRSTNAVGDSSYSAEAGVATPTPDVVALNRVTYRYDAFGNLVETNAGGVIASFTYDPRGRKTAMSDPDMGAWTYVYDALGQLVRQTDAKSNVSTMQYDLISRMTRRTEADLVSTWTFDTCVTGIGKLCSEAADNGYSRTYNYEDPAGRLRNFMTMLDSAYWVTLDYDSASRLTFTGFPSGFVSENVYNAFGYLSEVHNHADGSVLWRKQAATASGQITQEQLGPSLTGTRTYDVLDRVTGISASGAAGAVNNLGYSYDAAGNVTQRVDGVQGFTENFAYDVLNRLVSASGSGLVTRSMDYDVLGNITYKSDVGVYSYGAKPHAVTSIAGTVNASYIYDANGNLTSGAGRTLTYTSFNLPLTIAQGTDSFLYRYNNGHQRVRLDVTRATGVYTTVYLHPAGGSGLLYDREYRPDGSIEQRHYIHGTELVGAYVTNTAGAEMRYFHRDSLGSVVAITNSSGATIERLAYEAFGKRRFPNGTADPTNTLFGVTSDRGFTAHEHLDEIGLIHMNGRVYDPLLGRFMTADPFVQSPTNLQSYNRYSYTWNNPLAYTDPSGYFNVFKKKDWAQQTTAILQDAGRNKYLGGIIQMGLLTHPIGFGVAYGASTGDWKTVGRAAATEIVMAASIWAGGAAWAAYDGTFAAGVLFVEESAAIGYASSYATAYVNGASGAEAQNPALLSAKRAAGFAVVQIGARELATIGLEKDNDDPNAKKMTPKDKEQAARSHAFKAPGELNSVGVQTNGAGVIDRTSTGAYGPAGSWISEHIPFSNYAGLITDGMDVPLSWNPKTWYWFGAVALGVSTAYAATWGEYSAAFSAGQQFHRPMTTGSSP